MSGLLLPGDARVGVKPVRYSSLIRGGSPVSAWPLNEAAGAGTADDLISTNDGTPTAVTFGSTLLVPGHTSADFNGTTSVVVAANESAFDLTAALTVEAWINWDGGAGFQAVLSKWVDSAYLFGIDGSTDVLNFYVAANVSGIVTPVGATALSIGTPYHVAGTYDGTNHRVYLNGVQDGTRSTSGALTTNNDPLNIGRSPSGDHDYDGRIGWAVVYNRALTATEIQMHYVAGLRKRKLGLAA